MSISPLRASDAQAYKLLLLHENLPTVDFELLDIQHFLVIKEDGNPVAGIGLEVFGTLGLLRSLVVEKKFRKRGLGQQLVHALEQHSKANGLDTLFLLTTTAPKFFYRLGYEEIDREQVPQEVKQSQEFSSLCPSTALCMFKKLQP